MAEPLEQFAREALKAQHGKKVVVHFENGGPIIGEGVLEFHEDTQSLSMDMRIHDKNMKAYLTDNLDDYSIGE